MKITDINIYPYKKKGSSLKAFASVTFDESFAVKGIRIMKGKKGLFVGMPSQAGNDGEYYDIAFPVTKEFRKELSDEIIDAYENGGDDKPAKKGKKKRKDEDEDEDDEDDYPPF